MDAGAPSQAEIVNTIYKLKKSYNRSSKEKVNDWVDEFDHFLTNCLRVSDDQKQWYPLEDVYTPIDRSIADRASFKDYTVDRLIKLRNIIDRLVILAVRQYIESSKKSKESIDKFARYLIDESKFRLKNEKSDRVSVITTNWDILLDNKIHYLLQDERPLEGVDFCGVVDYCCYISSLDEDDHSIKPGLYAIGKGGYNVKLLKLHGSLNWMQCPKCQRLYVKYYKSFSGGYVFDAKYCRHCERNFGGSDEPSSQLNVNLIMPTFLKNLDNIQNKLIWQNAGIELSEATKVVFIGYSLPQADFEFKQLLSRMIRVDAEIEVVLRESDNPYKNGKKLKPDLQTAGYRFENFFSGRPLDIFYDGVANYLSEQLELEDFDDF